MSLMKNARSEAKLAACRDNAKLSTGPRTEAGKEKSSQNARTHGFTSQGHLNTGRQPVMGIPAEVFDAYHAHRTQLIEHFLPANAAELDIFDQLAHSSWILQELRHAEVALLCATDNPFADPSVTPSLSTLERYRNRHNRDYHRSLKSLQDLQTQRLALEQLDSRIHSGVMSHAPAAQITRLTNQTDKLLKLPVKRIFRDSLDSSTNGAVEKFEAEHDPEGPPTKTIVQAYWVDSPKKRDQDAQEQDAA